MTWQPALGAWPEGEGTRFRVWAPQAQRVEVVLDQGSRPLNREAEGTFSAQVADVRGGVRYRYRVDNGGTYPDPASRFQPEGVHGPSEVVDPRRFHWSDAGWRGIPRDDLIIYELHIGTFTPAGTFAGVIEQLPYLAELGVNAIELLPVSDFPGQRNWGYDGVCPFAPTRCYGAPDDLRRLVDAAHRLGLAVLMDVVYNHLGPDGNYLGVYSPFYFSKTHKNPWGTGLNFDGPHSDMVRRYFIENALYWIHEYHMDGLRLDATQAIIDKSERHFLAELAARVKDSTPERHVVLIAEDSRNLAHMLLPAIAGGWGVDGVWADDFHHQLRRYLAGDHESYYADFSGALADVATTIRQGWFYTGQVAPNLKAPRGTDPHPISPAACVVCLQNHDQVGNRAFGERLHHQIDPAVYRAATVLLLTVPETPMLFMGQEWAAHSPFLFFTDHKKDLGRKVTEGRRREFRQFSAFSDPQLRERIPDPQAPSTFQSSKLDWNERAQEPHAATLRLHQRLIQLRRQEPALRTVERQTFDVAALGETTLALCQRASQGSSLLVVVQLRGGGTVDLQEFSWAKPAVGREWEVVLTTEDAAFCSDPRPPRIETASSIIHFERPGALLLRER